MNILDKIVTDKVLEVQAGKQRVPVGKLEGSPLFGRPTISLRDSLEQSRTSGIIAEFKRKSPSRGNINEQADPVAIARSYIEAGASGLSVLTDQKYFAGSAEDLIRVRETHSCPILRKDFIIDEYQVLEARAWGADVILLIAAVLGPEEVRKLSRLARSLQLEVLLEIHDENELQALNQHIDIVGVNNRDLKKMKTDVNTSMVLSPKIPADFLKISESGISDPGTISRLAQSGYKGFLIGEYFMQHADPGKVCRELIKTIPTIEIGEG